MNTDTRTKPLPLTDGHGRYMAVTGTLERKRVSIPYNGRFASETDVRRFRNETATWIQKWFKILSARASRKL